MPCAICDRPSAYTRAVVDTVTDEILGSVCRCCRDEYFGRLLEQYEGSGSNCLLCDRDGFYAMPKWQCTSVWDEDGVVVTDQTATVESGTPRLCERHFFSFRSEAADEAASTTTDRPVPRPDH